MAAGRTIAEVRQELAARGARVPSRAWVGRLRTRSQSAAEIRAEVAERAHVEASSAAATSAVDAADERWRIAERSARDLEALAQEARERGDVGTYSRLQRVLHAALMLAQRLAPMERVSPDERPDMVAAAARCMDRLTSLRDRVRAERATWPRCPACGAPVRPGVIEASETR